MGSRIDKHGGIPNIFENNPRDDDTDGDDEQHATDKTHEDFFHAFSGVKMDSAANRKHIKQKYIEIDRIHPDAAQPRRTIPGRVRGDTPITPETIPEIFEQWLDAINDERENEFELHRHLVSSRTEREDEIIDELEQDDDPTPFTNVSGLPPLEASFQRVVDLAASIRQDGLMNPVTVAASGNGYVLETGERRWLAVHLLRWHFGVDDENERGALKWDKIPAVQIDQPDVWRQAAENNVRDDLNAVSKARQLALLLMDIHNKDSDFKPIGSFDHEQDFYAQVANGYKYRIPVGMGEKLANVLGFSSPKQVRDYRRLLKIERDLWDVADDENWTEGAIREAVSQAKESVPTGTLKTDGGESVPTGTPDHAPMPKPVSTLYNRYADPKKWRKLPSDERREIYDYLNGLIQQMEQMGFDD